MVAARMIYEPPNEFDSNKEQTDQNSHTDASQWPLASNLFPNMDEKNPTTE
jgi:hypothetical protein